MRLKAPFAYYTCPCDSNANAEPHQNAFERTSLANKRASRQSVSPVKRPVSHLQHSSSEYQDEPPFNPHDPLCASSLFPLDDLLFCDECNQIRCPKCWQEEIINWYCPQCLFEVPSSVVRGDGNRCSRSCYQCPICTASLSIAAQDQQGSSEDKDGLLKPPNNDSTASSGDSYIMQCGYCSWSSLDIGVKFPRPTKVSEQLNRIRKARVTPLESQSDILETKEQDPSVTETQESEPLKEHGSLDDDTAFEVLTKFYKGQLEDANQGQTVYGNSAYSSPANLARIMSLYGGLNFNALKKSREKPQPMREAQDSKEGLQTYTAHGNDDIDEGIDEELLSRIQQFGWSETTGVEQRLSSSHNFNARFVDQLWPVATPLRIRRGKRCATCRQFISRPEPKVSSFRYKIRLLAQNHIPRLALKPLNPKSQSLDNQSFKLKPGSSEDILLQPHATMQYILTVRNPIFETVRITLASPATTPGRVKSRVTILCPNFTVGPAGDLWDDALDNHVGSSIKDGGRNAAMVSLTGLADGGDRQPEAGKVWDRTRSSTSVILEVVPGTTEASFPNLDNTPEGYRDGRAKSNTDDILAIPIFVRVGWETDGQAEGQQPGVKGEREARELAYWCVLSIGKIAT